MGDVRRVLGPTWVTQGSILWDRLLPSIQQPTQTIPIHSIPSDSTQSHYSSGQYGYTANSFWDQNQGWERSVMGEWYGCQRETTEGGRPLEPEVGPHKRASGFSRTVSQLPILSILLKAVARDSRETCQDEATHSTPQNNSSSSSEL